MIPQDSSAGSDCQTVRLNFANTYARLPERFYARVKPIAVAAPRLIKINVELAQKLGLNSDALATEQGVAVLSGNCVAEVGKVFLQRARIVVAPVGQRG